MADFVNPFDPGQTPANRAQSRNYPQELLNKLRNAAVNQAGGYSWDQGDIYSNQGFWGDASGNRQWNHKSPAALAYERSGYVEQNAPMLYGYENQVDPRGAAGYNATNQQYLSSAKPGEVGMTSENIAPPILYKSTAGLLNTLNNQYQQEYNPFEQNVYGNNPAKARVSQTLAALEAMQNRQQPSGFGSQGLDRLPGPTATMGNRLMGSLAMQEPGRIAKLQEGLGNVYQLSGQALAQYMRQRGQQQQEKESAIRARKAALGSIPIAGPLVSALYNP